ncbi:hypothetical protein RQP46_002697 [Phenoliferia psychrophenolica]
MQEIGAQRTFEFGQPLSFQLFPSFANLIGHTERERLILGLAKRQRPFTIPDRENWCLQYTRHQYKLPAQDARRIGRQGLPGDDQSFSLVAGGWRLFDSSCVLEATRGGLKATRGGLYR